jgi:hypothetical protein
MTERDLKLNTIGGLTASPRLVLEEHGSCEVPAGCGGVIMRWRRRSDIPLEMWLYTTETVEAFLDGDRLASARPLVGSGAHVLAFRLPQPRWPKRALMLFAAFHSEQQLRHSAVAPRSGLLYTLVSDADGSWRYDTTDSDDADWMQPGYDDTAWRPMIQRPMPREKNDTMRKHYLDQIVQLGGKPVGGDVRKSDVIRIRRAFTLAASTDRPADSSARDV